MKLKNIFIVAFIAFSMYSCDDAINVDPADEILEDNAIVSVEDVELATIGVYATLPGIGNVSWNSRFTDELQITTDNNGQGVQVHTWSINSSTNEPDGLFRSYYTSINRANKVLSAMGSISASSDEEQDLLDRYRGELLAIRGWAHFKLLSFFSSSYTDDSALAVPYIDYSVVLEKPARNTVGEVLIGISEDLSDAKALLPESFTTNTFFTKDAVIALQSRIALYTEDYPTAITLSTDLISRYSLSSINDYASLWNDSNNDEIIFKLARVAGDGAIGQIFNPNSALTYFVSSDKLFNSYASNDIRGNVFHTNGQKINKYPALTPDVGLNHIKIFRISEQYLIRAEAYANTNSQILLAQNDINTLRGNRLSFGSDLTFTSQGDAISKILNERFLELAFEGHRFFDLKRTGTDIDRENTDCEMLQADNACSLSSTDHKFTLPIPQSEIFVNPNMVQNTGYQN